MFLLLLSFWFSLHLFFKSTIIRTKLQVEQNNYMKENKKGSLFDGSIFGYTWKSRGIVFLTTIVCALIFMLIGYSVSILLGKAAKPFVIIGVVFSFPIAQLIIYKLLVKNKNE